MRMPLGHPCYEVGEELNGTAGVPSTDSLQLILRIDQASFLGR